ncbi:hypothetical protein JCM8547_004602 [Rhodosporidiobolus lusitaniae]
MLRRLCCVLFLAGALAFASAQAFAGAQAAPHPPKPSSRSFSSSASPARPTSSTTRPAERGLRKRDGERAVFAHVVQGDWQNYSEEDYANDFALAKEAGIAAFALNVGRDSTDADQLVKAFAAAEAQSFFLFYSFDFNGYFSSADSSSVILETYLKPYAGGNAYYLVDGKALVSTFSGGTDGTYLNGVSSMDDSNAAWKELLDSAAEAIGREISFAPGWFSVDLVSQQTYGGGILSWAAWGDKGRTDAISTSQDESYISAAASAGLYYIAPVAAFFFVHVAEGNNYVLQSNDFLLPKHYGDLLNLDPTLRFVELLSFNDYGESHYLGTVRDDAGVPDAAKSYVDTSRDHSPMLWASAYWNLAFTNGSPPEVTSECIVWYYRPHPAGATASSDSLAAPDYADTLDDKIYAIVFIPSGSKATSLVITTGGSATDAKDVTEGVNLLAVDFVTGATGVALLDADGNELLSGTGDDISSSPSTYDFNFRTYIVPQDATASTFLGGASTSSSGSESSQGADSSSSTSASSGSTVSSAGYSSATSAGKSGGSSTAALRPSSEPSPSSLPIRSSDDEEDESAGPEENSASSSSAAGLPTWTWAVGFVTLASVGVGVYLCARHGDAAPVDPALAEKLRESDSDSSDGNSTNESDSSASTVSNASRR